MVATLIRTDPMIMPITHLSVSVLDSAMARSRSDLRTVRWFFVGRFEHVERVCLGNDGDVGLGLLFVEPGLAPIVRSFERVEHRRVPNVRQFQRLVA